MNDNEYCKRLYEESEKYLTIPENKRYEAHFEHKDLVKRLKKLKEERKKEIVTSPYKLAKVLIRNYEISKSTRVKTKNKIEFKNNHKIIRINTNKILPTIKEFRIKIEKKANTGRNSYENIKNHRFVPYLASLNKK